MEGVFSFSTKAAEEEIYAVRQGPGGQIWASTRTRVIVLGQGSRAELPDARAGVFLELSPSTRLMATRGGIYNTRAPYAKEIDLSPDAIAAAWSACGKRILVAERNRVYCVDVVADPSKPYPRLAFESPDTKAVSFIPGTGWMVLYEDRVYVIPIEVDDWSVGWLYTVCKGADNAAVMCGPDYGIWALFSTNHEVFIANLGRKHTSEDRRKETEVKRSSAVWNIEECEKKTHAMVLKGSISVILVDHCGKIAAKADGVDGKIAVSACLSLNGKQLIVGSLGGHILVYDLPSAIASEVVDSGAPMVVSRDFGTPTVNGVAHCSGRPVRACRLKAAEKTLYGLRKK